MKDVDVGEPTSFLDHVYLGCTQRECKTSKDIVDNYSHKFKEEELGYDNVYLGCSQRLCETSKDIVDNYRNMFESRISAGAKEKLPSSERLGTNISAWSFDMEGQRLANKTTQQLYIVTTPCIDDHQFKEEELGYAGELPNVCLQIVLKCMFLARIGRRDIVWSVNIKARAVTKWTRACDRRLGSFDFSYTTTQVNLSNIVMRETRHNNADWDCFKTLILPEILKTQNRPQVGFCVSLAVTRLFPLVGCVRNKPQSHTVRQNLKLFLLMQVYAWMEFPLSISGIWF